MIYFVQALQGGPIKIGFTDNVKRRMSTLRSNNGQHLVLLGVMEGTREDERHIHALFECIQGEWFRDTESLYDYIRLNCEDDLRPLY